MTLNANLNTLTEQAETFVTGYQAASQKVGHTPKPTEINAAAAVAFPDNEALFNAVVDISGYYGSVTCGI